MSIKTYEVAKIVANGMKKVINCKRISIVVMGLEVPHAYSSNTS